MGHPGFEGKVWTIALGHAQDRSGDRHAERQREHSLAGLTEAVDRAARDPSRCVYVADRESDIYALFCTAQDSGMHFLLRTCVDRLAGDGMYTIAAAMKENRCRGLHRVDRHGEACEATLELKFRSRIRVLPPIGKQNRYPEHELTVLHATQGGKVITDLPITSRAEAIEKLWRI
jgi:hypothetical protein